MSRRYQSAGALISIGMLAALVFHVAGVLEHEAFASLCSAAGALGILVAACLYVLATPVGAWAWSLLLRDARSPGRVVVLMEIMAVSQLAKYLPGNFGHHVGRVGMALARGIDSTPLLLTLYSETVLTVCAGVVIGVLGVSLGVIAIGVDADVLLATVIMLAFAWFAGLALISHFLPVMIGKLSGRAPSGYPLASWPRYPTLMRVMLAYVANYLFIGLGMFCLATLAFPERSHDFFLLAGGFAVAWIVGSLTPGAPAGLGVRDAALLGIISTAYSASDAALLVVMLRLSTLLGDLITFLCGLALVRLNRASVARLTVR